MNTIDYFGNTVISALWSIFAWFHHRTYIWNPVYVISKIFCAYHDHVVGNMSNVRQTNPGQSRDWFFKNIPGHLGQMSQDLKVQNILEMSCPQPGHFEDV